MRERYPGYRHYSWQGQQFVTSCPVGRHGIHIRVESFDSLPDSDNADARSFPVHVFSPGLFAYKTDILHQP
jgi:hypothetical protein